MEKSPVIRRIEEANARYVEAFGDKGRLAVRPVCRYAILMCMDSRMLPSRFAGLAEGDAHIIRNAGGRASDDAIRSLIVSYKLLGTKEFFVIHHTDCGMVLFDNRTMTALLEQSLEQAVRDGDGWKDVGPGPGSPDGAKIDWLTFTDERLAVIEDVSKIRNHPLIPRTIPIYGYVYDVRTGRLDEVPEAMAIGAPVK